MPEPGGHAGLTQCAPIVCAAGRAQANRRMRAAVGMGRALSLAPTRHELAEPVWPPMSSAHLRPSEACCAGWNTGGHEDWYLLLGRVPVERAFRAARLAQVVIFSPSKWGRRPLQTFHPRGSNPRRVRHSQWPLHACAWRVGEGGLEGTHREDVSNYSDDRLFLCDVVGECVLFHRYAVVG